ncbi:MAG TPA: M28 family peptidase, partial [Polyangiaceae bacterium]|nr:M28 family peptidase [Polyangiaceae bacterium]
SGVAVLLETARLLRTAKRRTRDVYFVAFTAEESGVLGSTHFVRHLPRGLAPEKIQAMLNMDMVGRLRNNRLQVLGGDSAKEWQALLAPACAAARIECNIGGDGYGPSDQTPFFAAGIPVLHYFTGAHSDYHKPSDESRKINAAGAGQIAIVIANTASALFARRDPLTLRRDSSAPVVGDMRSSGASLGTIPDYAGPPGGQRGVLLAGVRKGGAAETGGLQRGDILVKLGKHDIGDVRDLMFALGNLKPGESIKAVVLRNKKRLELPVTLQEQRGH